MSKKKPARLVRRGRADAEDIEQVALTQRWNQLSHPDDIIAAAEQNNNMKRRSWWFKRRAK